MQALIFLLDAVTGFFTLLLLARFFMQLSRVSFANQIGTFVVQLTNWIVKPLRRVVPGVAGLDLASLLPACLLQCALVFAIYLLRGSALALDGGAIAALVLWHGLLGTLRSAVWLFIGALFLQAVLSWANPYSPIGQPVMQLTRPLLAPIQRILPPIANIDLSPLVAILLLQVVLMVL